MVCTDTMPLQLVYLLADLLFFHSAFRTIFVAIAWKFFGVPQTFYVFRKQLKLLKTLSVTPFQS